MAWGIFGLWFISFTVDMINIFPSWDPHPSIHGLMATVAGAAFIGQAVKKESSE